MYKTNFPLIRRGIADAKAERASLHVRRRAAGVCGGIANARCVLPSAPAPHRRLRRHVRHGGASDTRGALAPQLSESTPRRRARPGPARSTRLSCVPG
jgi:hypothetical protein